MNTVYDTLWKLRKQPSTCLVGWRMAAQQEPSPVQSTNHTPQHPVTHYQLVQINSKPNSDQYLLYMESVFRR